MFLPVVGWEKPKQELKGVRVAARVSVIFVHISVVMSGEFAKTSWHFSHTESCQEVFATIHDMTQICCCISSPLQFCVAGLCVCLLYGSVMSVNCRNFSILLSCVNYLFV